MDWDLLEDLLDRALELQLQFTVWETSVLRQEWHMTELQTAVRDCEIARLQESFQAQAKVGFAPPATCIPTTQDEAIDAPGNNTTCCKHLTGRIEKFPPPERLNLQFISPTIIESLESAPDSIETTTENCFESRVWTNSIKLDDGQLMIKQLKFDMIGFLVQPEPIYQMRHETFAWEPGSKKITRMDCHLALFFAFLPPLPQKSVPAFTARSLGSRLKGLIVK